MNMQRIKFFQTMTLFSKKICDMKNDLELVFYRYQLPQYVPF